MDDEVYFALAESHIAQATALRTKLESRWLGFGGAREVLWAIIFAHEEAAKRMMQVVTEKTEAEIAKLRITGALHG